jgi:hypothetical protein
LWPARAAASVEQTASKAKVRKQDSGRKRWFIPWSPRERLELPGGYHSAHFQLSRFGNSAGKPHAKWNSDGRQKSRIGPRGHVPDFAAMPELAAAKPMIGK